MNIFERIVNIRKSLGMSQKDFAHQIDVPFRSLQNYEAGKSENIPHIFIEKLITETSVNANWLITGQGNKNSLDPIFLPFFDILKTVCPQAELEAVETEVINDMTKAISTKIVRYLVDSLLKQCSDIPLFEKIKKVIILTDLGATVRLWSIIEQASINTSDISDRDKLVLAAKNGLVLNKWLISQSERDFISKFVEMWSDEICEFLLKNSSFFVEALKQLSPKASEAIKSDEKVLRFIRSFSK